ncbi:MAG TPA: hypothetical protein VM011_01540 [Gammaproteobacteria bacterium]|nr:hypothetical protein [Gammaproteobacteria bacterium]
MSSDHSTISHSLWRTLLVVFALQVAGTVPFDWNESRALKDELEIKMVVLEPGNKDNPATGVQHRDKQPVRLTRNGMLAVDTLCVRNDADTGTTIRGPPAGNPCPA